MRFALPLASALIAAPLIAQSGSLPDLHFGREKWHLSLNLPGLAPAQADKANPDRQTFYYMSENRSVIVSVIVENAHAPAKMASCHRVFEQRAKAPFIAKVEIKAGKRGDAALQEYTVNLAPDGSKVQRHIHTCRVRGNYYIDVHASKSLYGAADRKMLLALVDGVAIVD